MKVLIVASGTGGHVYPALSIAQEFSKTSARIFWIGSRGSLEEKLALKEEFTFFHHTSFGFRGKNIFLKLYSILYLIISFFKSLNLVNKIRPDFVFSTGNYSSLGPCFAAFVLRVPFFIHEQNIVPGSANKLLEPFSKIVFEGFNGSFTSSDKVKYVGNPVRNIFNSKNNTPTIFNEKKFRILILGGSQGSNNLNEIAFNALSHLKYKELFFIHHQSGNQGKEVLEAQYRSAGMSFHVEDFIENICQAMVDADLIISRSGAMAITEIAHLGKPSILLPLPWSIDDHQFKNAKYMKDLGGAIVIWKRNLEKKIQVNIEELVNDKVLLEEIGKSAKLAFLPGSAKKIYNEINALFKK
jgi:UDP-N-acetylglucosamine--N-acetylmuramyl-(pentapeptide) pyrophosphoryl-undecaprenol N-acetylglucosamine transferase